MFKNLLASWGIGLAKRFFLYLFGGVPPLGDKEQFRLWCVRNHRWLAMIVSKTANTWDDRFAAVLLDVLQSPVLYDTLWESMQKGTVFVGDESAVEPRFIARIRTAIANRRTANGLADTPAPPEAEAESVGTIVLILSVITNTAATVKLFREWVEKRRSR